MAQGPALLAKKTRRRRRVLVTVRCSNSSRLRLRLQPRIGTRSRLARWRYRGGAWRRGLQHRFAVRLLAVEQILDLLAGQGLVLQQTLGECLEIGALLG